MNVNSLYVNEPSPFYFRMFEFQDISLVRKVFPNHFLFSKYLEKHIYLIGLNLFVDSWGDIINSIL